MLIKALKKRKVKKGETVINQGEIGDKFYLIGRGQFSVYVKKGMGNQQKVADLSDGDFFGEMGLIDGSPRSADVVAAEACEMLVISKADFKRCLQENFDVALNIMKRLVERLREADRKIESLALMDVYGRVAKLLLEFSEVHDGQRIIRRKVTKQDIAKMIGASREMVSRVMKDLEASGYIRVEEGLIVLEET